MACDSAQFGLGGFLWPGCLKYEGMTLFHEGPIWIQEAYKARKAPKKLQMALLLPEANFCLCSNWNPARDRPCSVVEISWRLPSLYRVSVLPKIIILNIPLILLWLSTLWATRTVAC